MPVLVIFITNVIPIISITETLHKIASNSLYVSPICESSFIIFPSAIGWHKAEHK